MGTTSASSPQTDPLTSSVALSLFVTDAVDVAKSCAKGLAPSLFDSLIPTPCCCFAVEVQEAVCLSACKIQVAVCFPVQHSSTTRIKVQLLALSIRFAMSERRQSIRRTVTHKRHWLAGQVLGCIAFPGMLGRCQRQSRCPRALPGQDAWGNSVSRIRGSTTILHRAGRASSCCKGPCLRAAGEVAHSVHQGRRL